MKIAVCVKHVPEQARKIDPGTKRLDRSGEGAINPFDVHAVEEALRIKEAQGGEVVIVTMGPAAAQDSIRKALAMGADEALLISDEAAEGSDLVATTNALAAALEKEGADLIVFGQQSSDSDGAVLWASVADRLRLPVISQVAELEVSDGKVRGKRQTEFGYDTIEAPTPAVLAVSDAINEPRYPSLKGIMGARSKPQRTVSVSELGVEDVGEAGSKTTVEALNDPPPRGRHREDRGRRLRSGQDRRVHRGAEAAVSILVFLEHHDSELLKPSLGVLSKAATLGEDVTGVVLGSGVKEIASGAGKFGAAKVLVVDKPELEAPLPQPRVDALASIVKDRGYDTVLFAASVLSADVASGLSARLQAGLNWDLTDLVQQDGNLIGKRPALGDSVLVDVGWRSEPRLALIRAGTFDPQETGGDAEVEEFDAKFEEFSTAATMVERAHAESEGPSIEDADVIVAGGRGLGAPENFKLVEELAQALGGAVAATRAVVDAGWYPYSTQVGQTGKTVSPKLYIACGISGAIQHKVGMQSSGVIVAINKDPNAPIFEYSDLGVVGDLNEIVPKLTQLVRQRRS